MHEIARALVAVIGECAEKVTRRFWAVQNPVKLAPVIGPRHGPPLFKASQAPVCASEAPRDKAGPAGQLPKSVGVRVGVRVRAEEPLSVRPTPSLSSFSLSLYHHHTITTSHHHHSSLTTASNQHAWSSSSSSRKSSSTRIPIGASVADLSSTPLFGCIRWPSSPAVARKLSFSKHSQLFARSLTSHTRLVQ